MAFNADSLSSHTTQAGATSIQLPSTLRPPFSGVLKVDRKLRFENGDFKISIDTFYANRQLSAIGQLKATPFYPTPYILAEFANMAYSDCKEGDPEPPDGWQLLTTASNFRINNGYFGAAYWHPEHQQVVIAHRGTDVCNLGALETDYRGVLNNEFVDQMRSASTFANKVVTVLKEIEQEKKVSFEIFFTGHSLGGWLAQITAFTTEYLEEKGGIFLKKQEREEHGPPANVTVQDGHDRRESWLRQINEFTTEYHKDNKITYLKEGKNEEPKPIASSTVQDTNDDRKVETEQLSTIDLESIRDKPHQFLNKPKNEEGKTPTSSTVQDSDGVKHSYHPHTVVFDSPGCKDMLSKLENKLDVRYKGRTIDLQQLDVTSYLSAPNLINTCRSHVGTVYRIFTDLSDMGWKDKSTPWYNIATHKMDKIVQVFDPVTGQVRKDDEGTPKIQEVRDWPLSAHLSYGAELNNFFKWAQHLNNYHHDLKDILPNKVFKCYHRLRYQTEAYDESTKSMRTFNQDERDFLELYRLLRQVPELKPEDWFSEMDNAEAKETAQKLQNFQVDNGRIRCSDASTIHSLIPYVKRLVRHFPHIKEKVKNQFSSPQITNRFYLYETQRSVEKICKSPLDFIPDALRLREFLDGNQQIWHLRMGDGDAWAGITKVYRVLQNPSCTFSYSSEGRYTILKLKRLLSANRMINLHKLLESKETPHLLMIACGAPQTVNDEIRNIFDDLFNFLKQKSSLRVILTTQSEGDTANIIQQLARENLDEGYFTTYDQLTWSDLTSSSQRAVLEKTVIFQGGIVALNKLISAESMTDYIPLADLLQDKELRIGKEPVPSAGIGYNEKCYIDRTINYNNVIRQDIISDEVDGKFLDLLAKTEPEFKELCHQNPTRNVHLLVQDKAGEHVWQQSQGNTKKLHEYIDVKKFHSLRDLDKLLQQAKQQRVMLIADTAGMGKTTVLTHLSKQIKQKSPATWLVRIDLNDYTELLKAQKGMKMGRERVLEVISNEVLKLETQLEKELFKKSFEGNEINKVVVMVDGFDEISPDYKETVFDMLHVLKQTSLEQLWVTTRPHLKQELEDNLQQLSYTLQPFSEVEQVEFLKKFWTEYLNIGTADQNKLHIYAKALIRKLAHSISDKEKQFTGIPLQINMLAEAFKEKLRSFFESEKSHPELPHKLDLLELYEKFIDSRYNIFYEEKSKTLTSNVAVVKIRERDLNNIKVDHRLLALEELLTEDHVTLLPIYPDPILSVEELTRIGIVQRNNEGKLHFIHRTIAEYFVADFLIDQLTKKTRQHDEVQKLLLNKVLLEKGFHLIRVFFDGLLRESTLSNENLKVYGKKLDKQWIEGEILRTMARFTTVLHTAAKEDNAHIIAFLLDSLTSGEELSTVADMLIATDSKRQTALHTAAENDSVQALNRIWQWAGKVTTWQISAQTGHSEALTKFRAWAEAKALQPNQLKNRLFVAQDKYGNTAWHGAAQSGSVNVLETLWSWAKGAGLTPHELLLAQNWGGNTTWQLAAQTGHLKLLEKLGIWTKEAKLNSSELTHKLLLAQDQYGYTMWHRAAENGSLEALETLWLLVKESELEPVEMFLAQGKDGNTAWQVAAQRGHFKILKKLWEWANDEQMDRNTLKDKLLRDRDHYGYIPWHPAAERGSLKALETLRIWAKETGLYQDELKNTQGETTWNLAAEKDHFEVIEKLWVWAKEAQKNPNDLKKALLLAKDQYGYTVWHRAAQRSSLEELETLWGWAKNAANPI